MVRLRNEIAVSCILTFALCALAVPPYFWYSTHTIEIYGPEETYPNGRCWTYGTCEGDIFWGDLFCSHDLAAKFEEAVIGHGGSINGEWYVYGWQDDEVTTARWIGTEAEINYNDFLFYAAHGWGFGPSFSDGCAVLDPRTDIRFGSGHYLKWVMACSCLWFCHKNHACQVSEFDRWNSSHAQTLISFNQK
jgi:hypothetical protein